MENIRKKIKSYVGREYLLEFDSPEECMRYFNTYDGQNFKTVEEMKKYQDKYGFGYNGKWYHIDFDEGLDILEDLKIKPCFTDDELYILSDGMLALIRNINKAAKLVCDSKTLDALENELKKYRELNSKICKMLE